MQILIASLPAGFKDPDEFVQAARSSLASQPAFAAGLRSPAGAEAVALRAGQAFEEQVVQTAAAWPEWVGRRILAPYLAAQKQVQSSASTDADASADADASSSPVLLSAASASGHLGECLRQLAALLEQGRAAPSGRCTRKPSRASCARRRRARRAARPRSRSERQRAARWLAGYGVCPQLYVERAPSTLHWSDKTTGLAAQSPRPRPSRRWG